MKKNIITGLIILNLLLNWPSCVLAIDGPLKNLQFTGVAGGYTPADEYSMSAMIGTVITSALSLLGVVFVVLLIYGGFKWMKASGREEDVKTAQAIIRNAIIGLILTISSYSISFFVMSRLLY